MNCDDGLLLHLLTVSLFVLEFLLQGSSAALSVVSLTIHLICHLFELLLHWGTLTTRSRIFLSDVYTCSALQPMCAYCILKEKAATTISPSMWWKPTLDSACCCRSVAWLSSCLVLVRSLSRSDSSLRAWFSWVCSSCSLEAWLRTSFSWVERFLSSSARRPRKSEEKKYLKKIKTGSLTLILKLE